MIDGPQGPIDEPQHEPEGRDAGDAPDNVRPVDFSRQRGAPPRRNPGEQAGADNPDTAHPDEDAHEFDFSVFSEKTRRELQNNGIDEHSARLVYEYGKDPDSLLPNERAVVEAIVGAHPEVAERILSEMDDPGTAGSLTPEEQEKGVDWKARVKETKKRLADAEKAYNEASGEDKEARRQEWQQAIRDSKSTMDNELATELQNTSPGWSKALTTLAILFYMYIGIQYAMASAVEGSFGEKRR